MSCTRLYVDPTAAQMGQARNFERFWTNLKLWRIRLTDQLYLRIMLKASCRYQPYSIWFSIVWEPKNPTCGYAEADAYRAYVARNILQILPCSTPRKIAVLTIKIIDNAQIRCDADILGAQIRVIVFRWSLHNRFSTWHEKLRVYVWLWALISTRN